MNPKDPTRPRVGRRHLTLLGPMLVLALSACEESPTGRKQVTLVPDAQMAEIGALVTPLSGVTSEELLRTRSLSQDRRFQAYVGCVAQALVDVLPEPRGR